MIVKLLTEHLLEFLSIKGGCRGSSESTLVKMSNCWKSHATAHFIWLLLTMGHDCPVPVNKHENIKKFTPPPDPLGGVKYLNFAIAAYLGAFVRNK